jgi:hypothetical protein
MANVKISGLTSAAAAAAANEFEINEAGTSKKVTGAQIATYVGTTLDGDKGDITVSSSGATWTVDALAITTGKLAAGAATLAKLDTTGAVGKVLTAQGSGVAPTWESSSGARSGASYVNLTTGTTNVTLTSSSNQLQYISADQEGCSITLPDMTTCTKGTGFFTFYNSSSYSIAVKDNSGTVREYIYPVTTSVYATSPIQGVPLNIEDTSTANGVWHLHTPINAGSFSGLTTSSTTMTTAATAYLLYISPTQFLIITYNGSNAGIPYVKLATLDTSTKTFTFGSQITLSTLATNTRIADNSNKSGVSLDWNGTDRGLFAISTVSDAAASYHTDIYGFAIVSGTLYVTARTQVVQQTGNATYNGFNSNVVFHSGNNCFFIGTSSTSYSTNAMRALGYQVGLSGTTVTLTAATGNNVAYTNSTVNNQYFMSPTSISTFVIDDVNGSFPRFINYDTSTNTLSGGNRTSQTTKIADNLLGRMHFNSYSGNSSAFVQNTNSKIFYRLFAATVANAGSATVTVSIPTIKKKGFNSKLYESTSGTTLLGDVDPSGYIVTSFSVSASNYYLCLNGTSANTPDLIVQLDPTNTDFNFNTVVFTPPGTQNYLSSASTITSVSIGTSGTTVNLYCNVISPATPFVL